MRKIIRGDEVIVISGKDKGKKGTISKVVQDGRKVIIEGINVVRKHTKANPMKGEPGGIVGRSMPIDISNVAIYNPTTRKADRVGFKFLNEEKVRFYKSNGEVIKS